MKPVDQTESNDCMRACVCSILGLDANQVPNFMKFGAEKFNDILDSFLDNAGYKFIEWDVRDNSIFKQIAANFYDCYTIATGKSPRFECDHAVIYYKGEIVHDPHPSKEGIEGPIKWIGILFKKDPQL